MNPVTEYMFSTPHDCRLLVYYTWIQLIRQFCHDADESTSPSLISHDTDNGVHTKYIYDYI